ncbi:MAG: hypothetical protein FJ095_08140 [Deltaproteobacteria bacterium]|nr:hypothetical protein [Deltaproteobacteria bacterium]
MSEDPAAPPASVRSRVALAGLWGTLALVGFAAIVLGYREFLFSTDDAYISFRYVRNLLDGHGLVWNPAPFHRVDGYTSFGWVVLLAAASKVTGRMPPDVCHPLTLGLTLITWPLFLALAWKLVGRGLEGRHDTRLGARGRVGLVALAALGLVTNRTFLTWTSSGLEAAMFTCVVTGWALALIARRRRWSPALVGALAALSRPEGLLVWALTLGWLGWKLTLVGVEAWRARRARSSVSLATNDAPQTEGARDGRRREVWRLLVAGLSALVPVLAHALWHRATYGAWLPNTYYAKVARPEWRLGLRYVASFLIEYSAWPGVLVLVGLGLRAAVRRRLSSEALAVSAFAVGLMTYYGLIAGGDHFEFKVFHTLVPLYWAAVAWALASGWGATRRRRGLTLAGASLAVLASWPLAWGHHLATRGLSTRGDTFKLRHAMAPHAPALLRGYVGLYDSMQSTLIDRFYGMRHREHAAFFEWKKREIPDEAPKPFDASNPDVALVGEVGLLGYRFPSVAVIDVFGLNDRFIARYRRSQRRNERVGHEGVPPPGYLEAFDANVVIERNRVKRRPHKRPLTPERVKAIEGKAARHVLARP